MENKNIVPDYRIDMQGEPCPYPAINTLEAMKELKDGEIKSRYKEELNSQYKNEILLVKKRINLINKDMVEKRKLIKESEDYLENSK